MSGSAAIYPHLVRYVEWWLRERTDADGWAVYKCTWEAGEDDTPRLDPERRGDNVVSAFVRPVELQATMALSAGVLARFAEVLGQPDDGATLARGRGGVRPSAPARSGTLTEGRFRDWDARAGAFPGAVRARRDELLGHRSVPLLGAGVHAGAGRPPTSAPACPTHSAPG